jgi:hypothetical protein
MPRLSQAGAAGERTLLLAVLAFAMLGLLIMAIFAVFAWRSRRVPLALKRRWTTRIVVGNLFTMPVFWYQFVWKDRPLEQRPTLEQYIS